MERLPRRPKSAELTPERLARLNTTNLVIRKVLPRANIPNTRDLLTCSVEMVSSADQRRH
jgi:hypothetical protein